MGSFLLMMVFLVSACSILERPADPVAYIAPKPPVKPLNFKDIWVYQGNTTLLGTYELDSQTVIPTKNNTEKEFTFLGGVWEDGLSSLHTIYPFWKPYKHTFNLNKTTLTEAEPCPIVFDYVTTAKEAIYPNTNIEGESFERVAIAFDTVAGTSKTGLIRQSQEVYEGAYSGKITLDVNKNYIELATNTGLGDPGMSIPVPSTCWLEITYKSDVNIDIFCLANSSIVSPAVNTKGGLAAKDKWTTTYINMEYLLRNNTQGVYTYTYKLILKAKFNEALGKSEQNIYLDNIKILYL